MSFVNVRGRIPVDMPTDAGEAVDLASEVDPADAIDPGNSEAADSCYPSGSGQNGPIVDVIDEHGWPTAGLAAMARGA